MKIITLITLILVFISPIAQAKSKHHKNKSAKSSHQVTKKALPGAENSQLGTSFSFDAASVRGKYQMAGQGIAAVEDEKVLDDLLGLRRQFNDREKQESSRW